MGKLLSLVAVPAAQQEQNRIPITETLIAHLSQDELLSYAEKNGIDLALDHLNRTSVSVEDAYRIRDVHNAQVADGDRRSSEASAARQELIDTWQAKRQAKWEEVYLPLAKGPRWKLGMSRGGEHVGAVDRAWKAVRDEEEFAVAVGDLDPSIRAELRPVSVPLGAPGYTELLKQERAGFEPPVIRHWTPDGEVDENGIPL